MERRTANEHSTADTAVALLGISVYQAGSVAEIAFFVMLIYTHTFFLSFVDIVSMMWYNSLKL